MRLLPYEDFYIATRVPYSMLRKKVQRITDTSFRLSEPSFPKKMYYGRIDEDGFRIHHWIDHNSHLYHPMFFPPVIDGYFLDATNGEIIIRMKLYLHWTALLGLLLWLIVYGILFLLPLTLIFPDTAHLTEYALLFFRFSTVLVLICTYGTMLASFERKAKQERDYFVKLTEAYEVIER